MLRALEQPCGFAQRVALIRYYLHCDPHTIEEVATLWGQLYFALQFDGKIKTITIKKV